MATLKQDAVIWKETPRIWGVLVISLVVLAILFNEALIYLVNRWEHKEEYSYGYLIPAIFLFLIWQKKEILQRIPFEGAWTGVGIAVFGLMLFFVGQMSALYVVIQYSFLIVFTGMTLSFVGWKGFRVLWVPLFMLVFMVPLPEFLLRSLSAELQLLSSQLGVSVIRAFGISVYLEGNVIDLGAFKLQVIEACSGLRYLFPLMTFGFITAYFYKTQKWKRWLLFFSTIPITVLMNSFRIGVIGVTVEYWGQKMAEGFLHDFEGWAVFMACTGVLFLEMLIMTKIGKDRRPLREIFIIRFPEPTPAGLKTQTRSLPKPYIGVATLLVAVTFAAVITPKRSEIQPERKQFIEFPENISDWKGKVDHLDRIYVDALKFSDYILTDYLNSKKQMVNFYVAYYGSQRKGESAHSPRTCIPGGGWEIEDISQKTIKGLKVGNNQLRVNRAVISMGEHKQLVYYWFQERGRVITSEYLVKWYLFWDALTKNRTDGALVRLTAYVEPGHDISEADEVLSSFARSINSYLPDYIPG